MNNNMTNNDNNRSLYHTDANRCHCPQCKGAAGTARDCFNARKLAPRVLEKAGSKTAALIFALTLSLLPGKAAAGVLPQAVGARPHGSYTSSSRGALVVYSRTEQTEWGEGTVYYPHTAYWIFTPEGKIKTVENHGSSIDEAPEQVELAPGTYQVRAWSENDGLVTMRVVIKNARVTRVHLESGRNFDREVIDSDHAVTTRSGQVVGWKA